MSAAPEAASSPLRQRGARQRQFERERGLAGFAIGRRQQVLVAAAAHLHQRVEQPLQAAVLGVLARRRRARRRLRRRGSTASSASSSPAARRARTGRQRAHRGQFLRQRLAQVEQRRIALRRQHAVGQFGGADRARRGRRTAAGAAGRGSAAIRPRPGAAPRRRRGAARGLAHAVLEQRGALRQRQHFVAQQAGARARVGEALVLRLLACGAGRFMADSTCSRRASSASGLQVHFRPRPAHSARSRSSSRTAPRAARRCRAAPRARRAGGGTAARDRGRARWVRSWRVERKTPADATGSAPVDT